jgi:4-phytase/acid phosphatase/peptide/nickel transport system substrate-binding protein
MFKEWRSGDRFVVVANPNYWGDDGPHLDEITFRFLPDQQTRLASLQSGDIDVMWMDRGTTIRSAQKDDSLDEHDTLGNGSLIIFLLNGSKPPLDDLRVRQALSHAWDQTLAMKVFYRNTQTEITHPYGSLLDCGEAGYRAHDIEKAKQLLADYGQPVAFEMIHTTPPRGREVGQLMQQLFKRVGVTLNLKPVDQLQLRQRVFTNNYEMSGWRIGDIPDQGPQLFGLFHSKSGYNITKYRAAEMDALLEQQRLLTDAEARGELLCRIAETINRDAPILYAGGRRHYAFTRQRLKGLPALAYGLIRLGHAWVTDGK